MVILTDPQHTIKMWFDHGSGDCEVTHANLTYDSNGDGGDDTEAAFEATYALSEIELQNLFVTNHLDLVFVISKEGDPQPTYTSSGPINYIYKIGVQPVVIQKAKIDGTVVLNAEKLMWKAHSEVKRVIRENAVGSLKELDTMKPDVQRLGSVLLYGDKFIITVTSFTTVYSATVNALAYRKYPVTISEIRLGTTSAAYSSLCEASGIGTIRIEPSNPIVEIKIPGAAHSVDQVIGNPDVHATITIWDYYAGYQLLTQVNVSGTSKAVVLNPASAADSRNTIGYFAIELASITINDSNDTRTTGTIVWTFVNAKVLDYSMDAIGIGSTITFKVKADYYTETQT